MKERTLSVILLIVIALGFLFCSNSENKSRPENIDWINSPVVGSLINREIHVVVIDSCEYLIVQGDKNSLTHKGNCKFCEERRKK